MAKRCDNMTGMRFCRSASHRRARCYLTQPGRAPPCAAIFILPMSPISPIRPMKSYPTQFLLTLTQTITVERGHSLICLADRTTADYEFTKLKDRLDDRLIKAAIRKDKPGLGSTYTLRYFT